jgi:hypothetical protein
MADLVRQDLGIFTYLEMQSQMTPRQQPADRKRPRKDFDDMHKAAVKFAASVRCFGVRNIYGFGPCSSVPGGVNFDDYPDLEAMLTGVENAIMWMKNNSSMGSSWHEIKKRSARKFVEGVIRVIEWYTGNAIKWDTKGTPTAELNVLKEIVATVDPEIGESTINEALKHHRKSGLNPSGRQPLAAVVR